MRLRPGRSRDPLLTEAALADKTVDLRALNGQAAAWCAEVNAAVLPSLRLPRQCLERRHSTRKASLMYISQVEISRKLSRSVPISGSAEDACANLPYPDQSLN